MRILLSTIAAAAMLGASFAPTGAPAQDIPTDITANITVWTWPSNDNAINAILPEFNKVYPNIKVEVQAFSHNNQTYLNTLQRAMLSNSGPDVAMVEIGELALLRERTQWEDLSKPPYNAAQVLADFAPFTVANVTLPDGKISLMPKHTGPGALFYRSDIFAEAGLPSDTAGVQALLTDWNAFIEAGKKVSIPDERWLVGSGSEIVNAIMAENGVSLFDAEGNLQFDNPVIKEALTVVKTAADAGLISPFEVWSPEWQGAFSKGQLASGLYGNWFGGFLKRFLSTAEKGKWSVVPAPAAANGATAFNNGGDYIGILQTSKSKEASWAFIKWFLTSEESLKSQFQNDDLYPAYLPASKEDWMNFADDYYAGQDVNKVFSAVQAAMVPAVVNPKDPIANTALGTAIQNIVRGGMSVDDAIAQAKTEAAAKL